MLSEWGTDACVVRITSSDYKGVVGSDTSASLPGSMTLKSAGKLQKYHVVHLSQYQSSRSTLCDWLEI